tara:strand:- start:5364 stop:8207 length:2844 start_codon:yes stop_codon:yes gene_type:complete
MKLNEKILHQLQLIDKSNSWINNSLDGEKQKLAYRNIVNFRRELNKKKFALEGNPAAAIYGESQVGKSYLVSALLSENNKPFMVYDGDGNDYDFINEVNPLGNEMESTSVVTRFSTKYKLENKDFPVIAKLLTPTDLILVLCEAYYNNLKVNKPLSFEELKEKIDSFELIYKNKEQCQDLIIEDDILNIEDYFEENFSKLVYNNIKDAKFFEKISLLVTRIPHNEWKDVFSLFWNFNPQLTRLFDDLINKYKQLKFSETVYLPIDTVLRVKGTILDVTRLDEIYGSFNGHETQYTGTCSVLLLDKKMSEETIVFSKPHLCGLIAELIFILPDSVKEKKPFLNKTDLLDFPGLRRTENTKESDILDNDLTTLLRRGRVDYLFNKYSSYERINSLFFCHNHKMSGQSVMPEKLDRWISNMVGETNEDREKFNSPVPPLFVISTWFNKDLEFNSQENNKNSLELLTARWQQRFVKTLKDEIFKSDTYSWLTNWTISKPHFQNIFLLRDFYQSSKEKSKIFRGYVDKKNEKEEIKPKDYPDFRSDLKKSFLENDFVQNHFENPEQSWDSAATMNQDGTNLIIEKITIAANHINSARIEKISSELDEILNLIHVELLKYFHSNDNEKELQKAKSTAGAVQWTLDSAFGGDGIKHFGQLMKELMVNESHVLELYRNKIDDVEHRAVVDLDVYSTYRQIVPVLEGETVESYFNRLCVEYEINSDEQKQKFQLELDSKKIDLQELINQNSNLIKNNSLQLAELLLENWSATIRMNDKKIIQKILVADGSSALQDIVEMFEKVFKKIGLAKIIAEKIRRYTDGNNRKGMPYEIIADISAELLNRCINSAGIDYYSESEIKELKVANHESKLKLEFEQDSNTSKQSVSQLFEKIDNWNNIIKSSPEELEKFPSYRNYILWRNKLKVAFVSVCDIPNYDLEANKKLDKIIKEVKSIIR